MNEQERAVSRSLRVTTFGDMRVISTDQGGGRLYQCACGWSGWSSWGHARRHAAACPQSGREEGEQDVS